MERFPARPFDRFVWTEEDGMHWSWAASSWQPWLATLHQSCSSCTPNWWGSTSTKAKEAWAPRVHLSSQHLATSHEEVALVYSLNIVVQFQTNPNYTFWAVKWYFWSKFNKKNRKSIKDCFVTIALCPRGTLMIRWWIVFGLCFANWWGPTLGPASRRRPSRQNSNADRHMLVEGW